MSIKYRYGEVIIMLNGKKIVLTGANSGIGLEILKLLVSGDNKILAVDLNTDKVAEFDPNKVFPFRCNVGTAEGVDKIFDEAIEKLGGIDIFHANAGFAYYEHMNYVDWDRIANIVTVNTVSPIYSFQKFQKYLDGREGQFALTISAIGQLAMPGWTLYATSKFALSGFQEGIRLEKSKNLHLTCLYPVATNTNFYPTANSGEYRKPWPMQEPQIVAKAMVKGLEKKKKSVYPYKLWPLVRYMTAAFPFIRPAARGMEQKKLAAFIAASETPDDGTK